MNVMNTTECIRHMVGQSGTSARKISQELGKSPTYLTTVLLRGIDVSAGNLAKIADTMGYELLLRKDGEEITVDPPKGENDGKEDDRQVPSLR